MGSRNGRPWVSQGPLDLWSSVARGLILMNFSKANKSIQATLWRTQTAIRGMVYRDTLIVIRQMKQPLEDWGMMGC